MQEIFKGIVTAIRKAPDSRNNIYTIISDRALNVRSSLMLELNDMVAVKRLDSDERGQTIGALEIEGKAGAKESEGKLSKMIGGLGIGQNAIKMLASHSGRPYLDAAKRMSAQLQAAASSFLKGYLAGAPIVIRFHNDGDGAGGAVSLYRALSRLDGVALSSQRGLSWVMQKGIEYDEGAMRSDFTEFSNFESILKPIVFITDFGTAIGSEAQFRDAAQKVDVVMLDHHPVYEGFPSSELRYYINPWEYGSDSNFTAGLLTSLFAEIIHPVETSDMVLASLISDYSSFADRSNKQGQRNAILLDYLTSIAGRSDSHIEKLTPRYIEGILAEKERADMLFHEASNTMNEMLELGVKSVKSYRGREGITAFVLDFRSLPRSESGYPLPGRYSSKLQEKLESINGAKTIAIVHYGSYITLRISKQISGSVGILKIIKRLEEESEYVGSGGGHNEAASIKIDPDGLKSVMTLLLNELGASYG